MASITTHQEDSSLEYYPTEAVNTHRREHAVKAWQSQQNIDTVIVLELLITIKKLLAKRTNDFMTIILVKFPLDFGNREGIEATLDRATKLQVFGKNKNKKKSYAY